MAVRTLPGAGLTAYWALGDNTYKAAMDQNFRLISALLSGAVISRTTTLPGSGAIGDIYIVPSAAPSNPNSIAIWDGEVGAKAWVYVIPKVGWHLYVTDTSENVQWTGSAWAVFAGGGGGGVGAKDEGTVILASASSLNFVGSGVVVTDGGSGQANIAIAGGGGGGGAAYDIVVGFITSPTTNQVFTTSPIVRDFELAADLVGSVGRVGTNPASSFVFTIRKNGTTVATVTVSTSGVFTMTTVGGASQSFAAGDFLTAQAPVGVDASIANLVLALKGTTL